jgi:hypothetical protein
MQCCGASSLGYKDWSQNEQYNCSVSNPAVERCGVPYSCCRQPTSLPGGGVGGDRSDSVDVEHANQIQHMPALTCWQSAQNRSVSGVIVAYTYTVVYAVDHDATPNLHRRMHPVCAPRI